MPREKLAILPPPKAFHVQPAEACQKCVKSGADVSSAFSTCFIHCLLTPALDGLQADVADLLFELQGLEDKLKEAQEGEVLQQGS
jgi:hypothetical protein